MTAQIPHVALITHIDLLDQRAADGVVAAPVTPPG
jgi:hypothetical protein